MVYDFVTEEAYESVLMNIYSLLDTGYMLIRNSRSLLDYSNASIVIVVGLQHTYLKLLS